MVKENTQCLYCAGTGRTKDDPYFCKHCNTKFIVKDGDVNNTRIENFGYIRDITLAKNWSKDYLISSLKSAGRNLTTNQINKIDFLQQLLNRINTNELYNDQIIISLDAKIYEVLIHWAYKMMMTLDEDNYNILGAIYNLYLIPNELNSSLNIFSEQVVFIEYNTLDFTNLTKLFNILSIRKRNGLPTYVLTNQPYKLFYSGGQYSVDEYKTYDNLTSYTTAIYI